MLSRTFSRRLMCAAISANLAGIGRNPPGHVARLCGQESQTASCLSHSAGIRKPSSAGVWFATGMVPPGLVVEALRQVAVGVDPAIAQEGPVRARRVDLGEVDRRQEDLLPRRGGPREDLPARARHEALAPELDPGPPGQLFVPDPVAHGHEAAVCHAVRALDRLPRTVLRRPVLLLLPGTPR